MVCLVAFFLFRNRIVIFMTEVLLLTLTCISYTHASSELCVPFQKTLLEELLFSRQFPSCSDVDFAENRPICEVMTFFLIMNVQIIEPSSGLANKKSRFFSDVDTPWNQNSRHYDKAYDWNIALNGKMYSFNPFTASAEYIVFFSLNYYHIQYRLLSMLNP